MTVVDERPASTKTDDDDHLAHVVARQGDLSASEIVMRARVFGIEVEALCGHRWIPQRDPEKHDVCQACLDVLGLEVGS